jgi:hypothetical protein
MKDLNAEEFNAIPETMREHFAEVEDNGAKVYRSKVVMAQAETLAKYKTKAAELDTLKSEYATKAEQAEAARIQALKEKGDFEELYKVESTEKTMLLDQLRSEAKLSLINACGDIFTDEGRATAKRLLGGMVDFDVKSKKYNFVDDDGKSLSVDESGFKEYLKCSKLFAPLVLDVSSVGGKGRNGSTGGSSNIKNPWAKDTFNLTQQARVMQENPQLAATLKSQAEA